MADVHTPQQRSFNMSRIRNRNTRPEIKVRSMVHRMGYRYRLHRKDLPGKPDLVFPGKRKVIFVHGCFFHMHDCQYGTVIPKTNAEFWHKKRCGNVERDRRNTEALERDGWNILEVWECQTKKEDDLSSLADVISEFLST
jgi:DNA mismatch endonuclease, patch repair protein